MACGRDMWAAAAVVLWAAACSGSALQEGQYACDKDQPGSCPAGWLCQCRGTGASGGEIVPPCAGEILPRPAHDGFRSFALGWHGPSEVLAQPRLARLGALSA